jgi:NitT/TauT family transport system permease protein
VLRRLSGAEALAWVLFLGVLWALAWWGHGGRAASENTGFDLSLARVPVYGAWTLLRMVVAFGVSLVGGVGIGWVAARSRSFREGVLSVLDLLQSVPVLGFLSLTTGVFLALFPTARMGAECACIFAIVTAQMWNLAFAFYQAMNAIPPELREVAAVCGMGAWQRFFTVELPSTFPSLVWNGMLSFGSGWFFVAQCETLGALQTRIRLPGLGSYVTVALERGDIVAAWVGLAGILGIVAACDQILWRPLLVWADKFRIESTPSQGPPRSWAHRFFAQSALVCWVDARVLAPAIRTVRSWRGIRSGGWGKRRRGWPRGVRKTLRAAVWAGGAVGVLWGAFSACGAVLRLGERMDAQAWSGLAWAGGATLARVAAATLLASLIWVPVGICLARSTRYARAAESLAQMAAAFPIGLIFPWLVVGAARWNVPLEWGSVLLMFLASQWYVLFNVLAGASAIPGDLQEVVRCWGLRGWRRWRTLDLPVVFPHWVTGACTAAGAAWNASIVAEAVGVGPARTQATGLGAWMVEASERDDTPGLWLCLVTMALLVAVSHRVVWRPLYGIAQRRFRPD